MTPSSDTLLSDAAPSEAPPRLRLAPERPEDGAAVEALMRRAFGPGHSAKTSERLREGNRRLAELCWCAFAGETLAGAVRQWPVRAGGVPFVFLGPIGVDVRFQHRGVGARLVERACAAAAEAGWPLVALVGHRAFFEPLGFSVAPPGRLVLPGPVDERRVLWRPLREGGDAGVAGPVVIAPDLGTAP